MRNIKLVRLSILFFILGYPMVAVAATLGGFSESLLGPAAMITQILIYACYVVGGILCLTAIAQYKVHRQSPKLVPLATPVMLFFLGIILLLLPYFSTLFYSGSAIEQARERGITEGAHKGLDLPSLEHPRRKGPSDFSREGQKSTPPTRTEPAPSPPVSPKGGTHWSDDPKYN